ncbi:MAG TPA: hypothetical protein VJS69_01090 [Candidatus Krumholzibacteria bacterium]|nr:hypothetical protein [Candidatus Krumholzibacteria bacterium]
MKNLFPAFPEDAKLWVYAMPRPLTGEQRKLVASRLAEFVTQWNSHGAPVHGAFDIVENQFVLIAGYVDDGVSGCSTDSMVRVMKQLREEGLDGFDRSWVFYRDGEGRVHSVTRSTFQDLVAAGKVSPDTPVFDNTVQFVGDLRRGAFETTFANAWHASAFSASPPR